MSSILTSRNYVPTVNRPKNHHYMGICEWNPATGESRTGGTGCIRTRTEGVRQSRQSGPLQALPALLRALARLPVSVVISTSGPPDARSGRWRI